MLVGADKTFIAVVAVARVKSAVPIVGGFTRFRSRGAVEMAFDGVFAGVDVAVDEHMSSVFARQFADLTVVFGVTCGRLGVGDHGGDGTVQPVNVIPADDQQKEEAGDHHGVFPPSLPRPFGTENFADMPPYSAMGEHAWLRTERIPEEACNRVDKEEGECEDVVVDLGHISAVVCDVPKIYNNRNEHVGVMLNVAVTCKPYEYPLGFLSRCKPTEKAKTAGP